MNTNKLTPKIIILGVVTIITITVIIVMSIIPNSNPSEEQKPEIITKTTLEKIINISDLSTFEAVYNGIAKVMNEKEQEQVDYYVSYNAKIKAGINFENIDISIDNQLKTVTVTLPEIKITDIEVDITSLDYIFENDKANTPTVSEQAYKKCIEDVQNESVNASAIYKISEQNAHNIVEALICPFIEQLDSEYMLIIN